MPLYIRHGEKLYNNGDSIIFCLDPGLTEKGKKEALDEFSLIIQDFEIPEKIISSPYLRTRQTAEIAQDVIFNKTGKVVPIFIDVMVGEYLGHQRGKDLNECLRKETLQFNPIPQESWNEFAGRLRVHCGVKSEADNVWYITHGLVIKMIAYFNGEKLDRPQPLEGICLSFENPRKNSKSSIQFVQKKADDFVTSQK